MYGTNAGVCIKEFGVAAKGLSSIFVVGRYLTGLCLENQHVKKFLAVEAHSNVIILRLCRRTVHQVLKRQSDEDSDIKKFVQNLVLKARSEEVAGNISAWKGLHCNNGC